MLIYMALKVVLFVTAVFSVLVAAACYLLRRSLPVLDATIAATELHAAVRIERDASGAVTVSGRHRSDIAYALGFAHGQDRRFQMDLLARVSAGELSAILGAKGLESDRKMRLHRFRNVARASLASYSAQERELLEAYASGVNAGTSQLRFKPFEYLLLRASPETWLPEDSILVNLSMFVDLQGVDALTKVQRGLIQTALPRSVSDFIYGPTTAWEAAIDGTREIAPLIPLSTDFDLRNLGDLDFTPPLCKVTSSAVRGSNNWAVNGARSASGAALVANDMHLGLGVPNIWYRARLCLQSVDGKSTDITGVTLPGAPMVLAGSNGKVAWGITNSFCDFQEVVIAVPDPSDNKQYLTPDGPKFFVHDVETIVVKGRASVELDVMSTQWGPVIAQDEQGRAISLEWTAHKPEASQIGLVALENVSTVTEALKIAASAGVPAVNFVAGDADGNIGWTIMGKVPKWKSADHLVPRLSTDPVAGLDGFVAPDDYPRIENPVSGQMATANARVVGGKALLCIGDGGYAPGVRAKMIQDHLATLGDKVTTDDMLAVQLNDQASFLEPWRKRLVDLLDENAISGHNRRDELRELLRTWTGHASINDAAYTFVNAFYGELMRRAYFALIASVRAQNPKIDFMIPPSFEGPLTMLLEQQPMHLLPPGVASWREFQLAAVDTVLESCRGKLSNFTWGRVNSVRIRHPLSAAIPGLGWLLDMPAEEMPGSDCVPRVSCPVVGVSERFAVSPGHEADAYFTMPGGQSGHPLSPFYREGHDAWVHGARRRFLPGPVKHVLELLPTKGLVK